MPGCWRIASTATLSPWTTLKTPSGSPASLRSSRGQDRGGRVLLGRLEDERVPARDRGRPHPHGHHRGEVERRDARHDAERLADRVHVDPGRGLLGVGALQQLGDPADVLDDLDAPLHLTQRVRQDLAVLGGEQACEILAMLVDELVDAEEELRALRERPLAPCAERGRCGRDGAVDVLGRCERDLARLLARGRVVDGSRASGLAADVFPADPVPDRRQFRRDRCVHVRLLAPPARRPSVPRSSVPGTESGRGSVYIQGMSKFLIGALVVAIMALVLLVAGTAQNKGCLPWKTAISTGGGTFSEGDRGRTVCR